MEVTLSPILIVDKLQDLNAKSPMLVTLSGIVTLVRLVEENAPHPSMAVTGNPLIVPGMVSARQ
jgi:hypothetical protein